MDESVEVDQREDLVAQSRRLRQAFDTCAPREIASISRELRAVNAEIAALPEPGKVSALDDLRSEHSRHLAIADLPAQATGTGHI